MAIDQARLKDVSTRGIAKEVDISRNTVRKYLAAEDPEKLETLVASGSSSSATMRISTYGHFR